MTGMHCNGCREKVEKELNKIDGVSATLTLYPPQAIISMEKHIPAEQLQQAVSKAIKHTISPSTARCAA
ncbi:heavy-metal-associated domain-containing protein [Parafilimonas sp.]|uniref:heavy-metal-associated domain-containing protein n=1 Tax=Parafilimonas sp. TaxID=1969739 RepID=UPI0039E356BD